MAERRRGGVSMIGEPFDVYCGFELYKVNDSSYVAKNGAKTINASNRHDIYAAVKLWVT